MTINIDIKNITSLIEFSSQSYLSRYSILFDMKIPQCDEVLHHDFPKNFIDLKRSQNIRHKFPVLGVNHNIHDENSVVLVILHYLLSIIDLISHEPTSLVALFAY